MLLQKIDEDLKSALKEKNEAALSSLRNLKAALKNAEIEKQHALTDDEAMAVIAKKVKQHKDSIESFGQGYRQDLVQQETSQMAVLQKYLPSALPLTFPTNFFITFPKSTTVACVLAKTFFMLSFNFSSAPYPS